MTIVILTPVWASVMFLDGHIEATRPHQRIPCSKGEEGCVGFLALVWGRRVDQLLGQVGRGGPRPCEVGGGELSVEVWRWKNFCLTDWKGRAQSCLLDWKGRARAQSCLLDWKERARPKLLTWLKGARAPKVRGLVIFLLLLVAAKSWWKQIRSRWYSSIYPSIYLKYLFVLGFYLWITPKNCVQ